MLCRNKEESDSGQIGPEERIGPEDSSYGRNYPEEKEREDISYGRNHPEGEEEREDSSYLRNDVEGDLGNAVSMETCAHSSSSVVGANTEADHLISMFQGTFQDKQVLAIYLL